MYLSIAVPSTAPPCWEKKSGKSVPPPKKLTRKGVRIMIIDVTVPFKVYMLQRRLAADGLCPRLFAWCSGSQCEGVILVQLRETMNYLPCQNLSDLLSNLRNRRTARRIKLGRYTPIGNVPATSSKMRRASRSLSPTSPSIASQSSSSRLLHSRKR